MLKEFREFIARGNVMDMAVGIIMGAAFTAIVNSMVGDLIMPLIGVATSGVDFADKFVALNGEAYASLKAAKDAGAPVITYGLFINAVINFIIVSFVIFMLVKGVNKLKRQAETQKGADAPPPPQDIVLLGEIRDLLKR
jgi:large conductance mechanosensitive channel